MSDIFSYKGINPSVCVVLFRADEVLLVKRSKHSVAEPGKLSFPGGHHDSNQTEGSEWICDKESSEEAALRELREETNISLPKNFLFKIGDFKEEKYSNNLSWTVTSAYLGVIPKYFKFDLKAMDDAEEAEWFKVSIAKNLNLAFNNNEILRKAIKIRISK